MNRMSAMRRRIGDRLEAVRHSVALKYEGLEDVQFVRFCMYRELKNALDDSTYRGRRTLEIGRSNGVIASFIRPEPHVVTGDFPAIDVCRMPQYADGSYDAVILDQVLEHVANPSGAIAEVHRVLAPGGICIVTTPFLIRVHASPGDYWRFTADGLSRLLQAFSGVSIGQWGNRFSVETCIDFGWITTWEARRRFRALLRNEPEWPICLWAIAKK